MRTCRLATLLGAGLLALGGCANAPSTDCPQEGSDSYDLGFDDGAAGHGPERIRAHREACRARPQDLDEDAWQAGYEDGLTHFCSPGGGLVVGIEGRPRPDVCPENLRAGFIDGFRIGREMREIEQRMTEIEREIRALEARRAGGLLGPALRDDGSATIRRLESEYDRLQRELRLLDLRADQMTRR